ncbi:MAG: transcriptional repressor [Eggerthellaceae bacterium]|jgi:Fe2+ or Zn2+ uptake regulation protein|nr:transcriptional repressor [Eggerthellaceae bacterium]
MRTYKNKNEQSLPASRNTIQRALVLDAVYALHDHPTSSEVYEFVIGQHPHISQATVYRNLDVLAHKGEIVRIDVPGGATRYDVISEPHYHVRCKVCGMIYDVDMPYMDDLPSQVKADKGFEIEGHQIMFSGLCPTCSEAQHASQN